MQKIFGFQKLLGELPPPPVDRARPVSIFNSILKNYEKNFFGFSKPGGQNPSHPPLGGADPLLTSPRMIGCGMQSLVALALTGTECIKNRQTNKLSSLYIPLEKNSFSRYFQYIDTITAHFIKTNFIF
jgi:hypothetical protein